MKQIGTTFIILKKITSLIETSTHSSGFSHLHRIDAKVGMTGCHATAHTSSHLLEVEIEVRFQAEEVEWILGNTTRAGC